MQMLTARLKEFRTHTLTDDALCKEAAEYVAVTNNLIGKEV